MKIRKAIPKDLKEIARLLHEYDLYEHALNKMHKIESISEIISFNKKLIKNPNVVYLVLEDEDGLQGVISGELRRSAVGNEASFHNIFISEKVRGKGNGRRLLKALEDYFKKKGCKSIKSIVYINNPSVNFYKKLGYDATEVFWVEKRLRFIKEKYLHTYLHI
jgi:L-amino acid N-acyltransferase YncA